MTTPLVEQFAEIARRAAEIAAEAPPAPVPTKPTPPPGLTAAQESAFYFAYVNGLPPPDFGGETS